MVLANRRDPPLDGEHYTKISGMWTLKYDIRSPKLYELLINKELKGYTDLYLNNFYNHIQMCLNEVTRLREYLLLVTIPSRDNLSLKNTSSHIATTLIILGIFRYTTFGQ